MAQEQRMSRALQIVRAESISRPTSVFTVRSSANASMRSQPAHIGGSAFLSYAQSTLHLFRELKRRSWLEPLAQTKSDNILGTVVRYAQDGDSVFVAEPANITPELSAACDALGHQCAFTMSSDTTRRLFQKDLTQFENVPYPIIHDLLSVTGPREPFTDTSMCYLCPEQGVAYVFASSKDDLLWNGMTAELALARWLHNTTRSPGDTPFQYTPLGTTPQRSSKATSLHSSVAPSAWGDDVPLSPSLEKKDQTITRIIEIEQSEKLALSKIDVNDEEAMRIPVRRQPMWFSIRMAIVAALIMLVVGSTVGKVLREYILGGSAAYIRVAASAASIPVFTFFCIFFFVIIVGSIFFMFGPIQAITKGNNAYYSSTPPSIQRHPDLLLPHITVQMPVYKEGLEAVIMPTCESVLKAIKHYEAQGGTANFYVAEDGMQAISPELADARRQYYDYLNIGWCARPKHTYNRRNKDGYERRGKFKKASNLNYCLDFSLRVETRMDELISQHATLNDELYSAAYDQALAEELEKDGGCTLAGGNVRIGEYILLIDCDTRVPVDCLLYGALELEESPEVAIVQHTSGVMQVVNNTFENAITYFTNLIYLSIRASVALGDFAPFVGHNAFLRWKAVQDVAFKDSNDKGKLKYWTDNNVSEDFDLALRLETAGYTVRLATYHKGEFKEGVSLTVFDELLRWEKYAYGTSELIFNPLYQWVYKGPFSRLVLKYIFTTRIQGASKLSLFGYLGTYFAIGFAFPLALANYFLVGWFNGDLTLSYLPSWEVMLAVILVFNLLNPLCYAWYRQRVGDSTFFKALLEHLKWTPVFLLFFNGLSIHVLKAILCHLFSIPIEWSATEKEIGPQGLMINLDRTMRKFKYIFVILIAIIGGLVYTSLFAPRGWWVHDFTATIPLSIQVGGHALLPIVFAVF